MPTQHQGGCVCGVLRYVTEGEPERVSMCHCAWCQKRTGTAFGTEVVFREAAVRFTKGTPEIYRHHSDLSGRWLDQHFCGASGSSGSRVRVDFSDSIHAARRVRRLAEPWEAWGRLRVRVGFPLRFIPPSS